MRKGVIFLVTALFLQSLAPVYASEGRSVTFSLEIKKFEWYSHEKIPVVLDMSGLQSGVTMYANWTLVDENETHVSTHSFGFETASSQQEVTLYLEKIYTGSQFYKVLIELHDSQGNDHGSGEISFTIFKNTIQQSVSNLLVFGDSLSDIGNAKASILNVPDVPPYWENRFSNGEVWIDHLSQSLGITTTHGSGSAAGDNRAFGGSQTGQGFAYLVLPNTGTQISNYLGNVQSSIQNDELVTLWAGGNDFLYGTAQPDTIAANMDSHIRQLAQAGAKEIILPNLPPLEKTPEGLSKSENQQTSLRDGVISYNSKLLNLANNLQTELSIDIHYIDAWSVFNQVLEHKAALGFSNIDQAACSDPAGIIVSLFLPICDSSSDLVTNPEEYLFFDKVHPTEKMHRFIGKYVIEQIGEADTDGDNVVDSIDKCEWTSLDESVDEEGCSWSQKDDDNDGVSNGEDICPDTTNLVDVNQEGCSPEQRDSDGDGWNDALDPCPHSTSPFDYDEDGCDDDEDEDDDNDTILDDDDSCQYGMIGLHSHDLDADGCHDLEDHDTDGDYVNDEEDAFPYNASEWKDNDGDGVGDNTDLCPQQFGNDTTAGPGCPDQDGDGVDDTNDAFVNDSSEWQDSDLDGFGDNQDACPNTYGSSEWPKGCVDGDNDGWGDDVDRFPDDSNEWLDSDNDTFGDNQDAFIHNPLEWLDSDNDSFGDNEDAFPYNSDEWNDSDSDGIGDNQDAFPSDASKWQEGGEVTDSQNGTLQSSFLNQNQNASNNILYGLLISMLLFLALLFLSIRLPQSQQSHSSLTSNQEVSQSLPDSDEERETAFETETIY